MGRHPDCDIVLDAGAVSRQHAQITVVGGDFLIEDLRSRNGTFVNGHAIQGQHKLAHGDRLKICDLSFTFYLEEPSSATVTRGERANHVRRRTAGRRRRAQRRRSTIMSKLDISTGNSGVRLSVNPEAKLRALIEISSNLHKSLAVDAVLPKVLDSLFKIFVQADRGFVVLRGPAEGSCCSRR